MRNLTAAIIEYLNDNIVIVLPRYAAWWALGMIFFGTVNGLFYWLKGGPIK